MKCFRGTWNFVLIFILAFLNFDYSIVQGKCLNDQRALLLHLNRSLTFSSLMDDIYYFGYSFTSKRNSWISNSDCCLWGGITCDGAGHVIGLDLSDEYISGGVNNSSSLFNLHYLKELNLANNQFQLFTSSLDPFSNNARIPAEIGQLSNLVYLNLSRSGFGGQIPVGISHMRRLVTLDLSHNWGMTLDDPDLATFTHKLTGLRELLLDNVNISPKRSNWCHTISSSLPKLQVLSLSYCSLSGPFDSSLLQLQSLTELRLSNNNFSTEIPDFLGEFPGLITLDLSFCGLHGNFPIKLLKIRTLQNLNLEYNPDLQGSLPEFPMDGQLQVLVLSDTGFSGKLPNSIGQLKHLSILDLHTCGFNGLIPTSISKLNQLQYLDLSYNNFTGLIQSTIWPDNLTQINLSHNRLTGPFLSERNKFPKLVHLDLTNNLLNGTLPMGLLTLPSIQELQLSMNQFSGKLSEFSDGSSSQLETLDLSNNQLQGFIPVSIFELSRLQSLRLQSNNFSGTVSLSILHKLRNLTDLDLSSNRLSVKTDMATFAKFPQLISLFLRSCNLTEFPMFLYNQYKMTDLDLSDNQMHQSIPNWIWKIGDGVLNHLNLSHNFLKDSDQPIPLYRLTSFDVNSNMLQGKNLIIPRGAMFLDYSSNNLTSMIPNLSSHLSNAMFFSVAGNKINGEIPRSICEAGDLEFLDLSHNNFSGEIPLCLGSMVSLRSMKLRGNNLTGSIPHVWGPQKGTSKASSQGFFRETCQLSTLDLNGNRLEGQVPKSLANCTDLKVLDVGNNQLTGGFPSWLGSMSKLRVLVLRSNKFYGPWRDQGAPCNFTMLLIIDISSNKFSGDLSKECFSSWKSMMVPQEEADWNHRDPTLGYGFGLSSGQYLQTVTITSKGQDMDLVNVQTINTNIDFSNNEFQGEIPEIIGNFVWLYTLNFSRNAFIGQIPPNLGNLTSLESLDLSKNKLTGEIPHQLAQLSFLSVLNLSFNKLEGEIPSGNQFQTFEASSFEGNDGLCGPPLPNNCSSIIAHPPHNVSDLSKTEFDWVLFAVTFSGFLVGSCMVIGPQYFWKKGREWANGRMNKILRID